MKSNQLFDVSEDGLTITTKVPGIYSITVENLMREDLVHTCDQQYWKNTDKDMRFTEQNCYEPKESIFDILRNYLPYSCDTEDVYKLKKMLEDAVMTGIVKVEL